MFARFCCILVSLTWKFLSTTRVWHFFFFGMDDDIEDNEPKMEANGGEQVAEASLVAVGSSRSMRKRNRPPFGRALLIVYKKVLSMIRQAFKMVVDLEKLGRRDLPGESTVQEMIQNTRIWLIDQMGKNFPRAKGNFLLKRWKKLEPLFRNLICVRLARDAVALSPPRRDVSTTDASFSLSSENGSDFVEPTAESSVYNELSGRLEPLGGGLAKQHL